MRAPSENRDDHSTRSGADARLTGRQIGWFGILPSPREDTKSVNLRIAIGTSVDLSNNSSLRETTTNPPGSRVCHKSATKTLHYAISVGNCPTFSCLASTSESSQDRTDRRTGKPMALFMSAVLDFSQTARSEDPWGWISVKAEEALQGTRRYRGAGSLGPDPNWTNNVALATITLAQ